jgi:hypothetical protein
VVVTPILKGTAAKLGLTKPTDVPVGEPYALIAMAFPMPPGTIAWRCLKGSCRGPRLMSDRELAEGFARDHAREVHGIKGPLTTSVATR